MKFQQQFHIRNDTFVLEWVTWLCIGTFIETCESPTVLLMYIFMPVTQLQKLLIDKSCLIIKVNGVRRNQRTGKWIEYVILFNVIRVNSWFWVVSFLKILYERSELFCSRKIKKVYYVINLRFICEFYRVG